MFKKKIDNKGRGPGEYLRIESIDINTEKEELMLVDGMSDKLFFYDLDGILNLFIPYGIFKQRILYV